MFNHIYQFTSYPFISRNMNTVVFLHCVLIQIHSLNSSRYELYEFGIFENFQKNKELLLLEDSLAKRMYDEKGTVNKPIANE